MVLVTCWYGDAPSIAAAIAGDINANWYGTGLVTAWDDGAGTIYLTTYQYGSQSNFSLMVLADNDSTDFPTPSFTISTSGDNLTGGADAYTDYDSGAAWVTVNGFQAAVGYGQSSTNSSVASAIANILNTNGSSPVTASLAGATLTLTAKTSGSNTNYSLSSGAYSYQSGVFGSGSFSVSVSGGTLTGGTGLGTTTYDTGTVWVTVNGYQASATYDQNSTASGLAGTIANALNASGAVVASSSGSSITITATAAGSNTNYSLSSGSSSNQPTVFNPPSFSASVSGGTLAGGTDGGSLSSPLITMYSYDPLGNLKVVQQRGGDSNSGNWRTRTFTYDGMSRLVCAANPEIGTGTCPAVDTGYVSGTMRYTYDQNSNLRSKTTPLGTISYCYDAMNRLLSKAYNNTSNCSSPVATFGYDGNTPSGCSPSLSIANPIGHRTGMCDPAGNEAWSYDSMGRPITDKRVTNNVVATTSYSYNYDGSINQLTYPSSGRTITYSPNIAAQPISAVDTANNITYASTGLYTPHGALRSLTNGGSSTVLSTMYFDKRLQPCRIAVNTSGSAPSSCGDLAHSGNILDLNYDFDLGISDNGNAYRIANNRSGSAGRSINYRYDPLNRIYAAYTDGNLWGETFSIDGWGNLTGIAAFPGKPAGENLGQGANTNNRLTNICGATCYDAAGNTINDGVYTYTYDLENRISVGAGVSYTYDGDGRRVMKSTSGSTVQDLLVWHGK